MREVFCGSWENWISMIILGFLGVFRGFLGSYFIRRANRFSFGYPLKINGLIFADLWQPLRKFPGKIGQSQQTTKGLTFHQHTHSNPRKNPDHSVRANKRNQRNERKIILLKISINFFYLIKFNGNIKEIVFSMIMWSNFSGLKL